MQAGGRSDSRTSHGLAFLMLLSFVSSFLVARAFATLNPDVVVISGIHFHHFWYGLAMMAAAGILSIVQDDAEYRRFYAILFGLGGGLVGDEVGLLLTFGNYDSDLTFFFFVIVVTGGSLGILLFARRKDLEYDVLSLGSGERLFYVGVVVAGLSTLTFATGYVLFGATIAAGGIAVAALGLWRHRKEARVADSRQKPAPKPPTP